MSLKRALLVLLITDSVGFRHTSTDGVAVIGSQTQVHVKRNITAASQPTEHVVVMFDFDQTISSEHVFKEVAGWDGKLQKLPQPYALSPGGQVRRLQDLEDAGTNIAEWAFGGAHRIDCLRRMFQELSERGVFMVVCTAGYPATVKFLLQKAGLLGYFRFVYGRPGSTYAKYATAYDKSPQTSPVIDVAKEVDWYDKVPLLNDLRVSLNLEKRSAFIVEDDGGAITAAANEGFKTVHVTSGAEARYGQASGMDAAKEMVQLLKETDTVP